MPGSVSLPDAGSPGRPPEGSSPPAPLPRVAASESASRSPHGPPLASAAPAGSTPPGGQVPIAITDQTVWANGGPRPPRGDRS